MGVQRIKKVAEDLGLDHKKLAVVAQIVRQDLFVDECYSPHVISIT